MANTKRTALSEDVAGRDLTRGAPGTRRGLAGTAGTEGANVPRTERDPARAERRGGHGDPGAASREPSQQRDERGMDLERRAAGNDEADDLGEADVEEEGVAGEGSDQSGTLPGSVGGTTGTAGHSHGTQAPGSDIEPFPGLSPQEAERLRRQRRRKTDTE